jgi:hypothetical protein
LWHAPCFSKSNDIGAPMCFIISRSQNVNTTTITLLQLHYYHNILAPFTLIILFSKVLKFSIFVIYNNNKTRFCDENYWIFKNILFVEWKFSNLFIYLTDMCQSSIAIIYKNMHQLLTHDERKMDHQW